MVTFQPQSLRLMNPYDSNYGIEAVVDCEISSSEVISISFSIVI